MVARQFYGGLISLFIDEKEVREIGVTPGWDQKDRDDFIARYNEHDTLRAQLEAAEASAGRWKTASMAQSEAAQVAEARAEAAEADAQRWRTWRALEEHAAAEVAWFAGGPEDRDAEIDARTKEETK